MLAARENELTLSRVPAKISATRTATIKQGHPPMNQNSAEEGVLVLVVILCAIGIIKLVSALLLELFSEVSKAIH
jgi:hypothetical protein